jgi:hypothetical protein
MKLGNRSIVAAVLPLTIALLSAPVFAQNDNISQNGTSVRNFSQDRSDGNASQDGSSVRVIVNHTRVNFQGQPPIEQDGRVLVPLRGVLEQMGAYVDYDQSSQTVTAFQGPTRLSLPIGSRHATVNGQTVRLDVPAQVINGSTMVPLRFVAETLGANVAFDSRDNTVRINSNATGISTSAEMPADDADQPGAHDEHWHGDRDQNRNRDQNANQDQGRWRHDHDNSDASSASDFRGEFSSFTREGENTFRLRTSDGREIRILKSVPVYYNNQRINAEDLRPGDRLTIAVDPDTGVGTRVIVHR